MNPWSWQPLWDGELCLEYGCKEPASAAESLLLEGFGLLLIKLSHEALHRSFRLAGIVCSAWPKGDNLRAVLWKLALCV